MKNILFVIVMFTLTLSVTAQTASVEKSIFGVQTGFLGVWVHNEAKLTNEVALRSEIGFDSGIWGGSLYENTGFLMIPVITLEPRWYYNLAKRENQSKSIVHNSGNFFSLKTCYQPDWFIISNYSNVKIYSNISITPTWGIKRNLGSHFNYEAGLGVGYRYIFAEQADNLVNKSEPTVNLHLRIGYTF